MASRGLGCSCSSVLLVTLALVVLRATGVIHWSWWLVLTPLLFTVLIVGVVLALLGVVLLDMIREFFRIRDF